MSKKKKVDFKGFPKVLPRTPKSKKLAAEFAKKNPKKVEPEKKKVLKEKKNIIEPLVRNSDDGAYISTQSDEKFEDLFHLITNLK